VRVTSGLPAGKTYPPPKDPVVMDQNGCIYQPHVFVIPARADLEGADSDGVLHNVHALRRVNGQFNMAMPPTARKQSTSRQEGRPVLVSAKSTRGDRLHHGDGTTRSTR